MPRIARVFAVLGAAAAALAPHVAIAAGQEGPERPATLPRLTLKGATCTQPDAGAARFRLAGGLPEGAARDCIFDIGGGSGAARAMFVLRVWSSSAGALLSVQVRGTAPGGWGMDARDATEGAAPAQDVVEIGTDAPVADVELLVPLTFTGTLTVTRLDLGKDTVEFQVDRDIPERRPDALTEIGDRGQSARLGLPTQAYQDLLSLARGYSARSFQDVGSKQRTNRILSAVIGRDGAPTDSATTSEPLAIFVGLAGLNKVILVDRVAWPMVVSRDGGERLAEPWQTTFERASHFWAVYVEEDAAPFFTSIDAEFRRSETLQEHDDFDPQGVVRRPPGCDPGGACKGDDGKGTIPVRLGYKRFRIPDGFHAIRLTFSRQSASYGLRQWSRVFTKYGRFPVGLAGAVVVPAPVITRRDYLLTNVFAGDSVTPSAYELDETESRQPLFAAVALRFPHLRASADQAPFGWPRLWRTLTPEPLFGLGVPTVRRSSFLGQSLLVAGSWPVVSDRIHFAFGRVKVREPYAVPGIAVPSRLAERVPVEDVRELRSAWKTVAAISVDLVRTW